MWPHASIARDSVVKTPAFDRIAREGVYFRRARRGRPHLHRLGAAILTGQWPWRLGGGINLYGPLDAKYDVYPDLLERAGYAVGLTGKGWGPGDFKPGGRSRNPAGPQFKSFDAFLESRPKDKPFCFFHGSRYPHRAYRRDEYKNAGLDPAKVKVPPYLPDNDTIRRDICDYYTNVQAFDTEVLQLMAALEKTGQSDNTLLVMSGDNGWPFPRCKATLYDTGTHQPLAIRWPALQNPAGPSTTSPASPTSPPHSSKPPASPCPRR